MTGVRLVVSFLMVVLAMACASPDGDGPEVSPVDGNGTPSLPGEDDCVDLTGSDVARITLTDFAFEPACSTIGAGQSLSLPNEGTVEHNFSLEGPDVDLDVAAGAETNTEAVGGIAQPGTYALFCKFHRAQGMEGEVTIRDASG